MPFSTSKASRITFTQLMLPSHSNFSGKIHGGYILNLMDQVAFACASKHSGHYCVTASVNKVDFLNPIEVGELVSLKASVNFTGKTSMVVGLRVESENIRTGEVKHCNSSYFTMVAKEDDGNNVSIPGLLITNQEGIRRFARSMKRKEHLRKQSQDFHPQEFDMHEHIASLKSENVRIDLAE